MAEKTSCKDPLLVFKHHIVQHRDHMPSANQALNHAHVHNGTKNQGHGGRPDNAQKEPQKSFLVCVCVCACVHVRTRYIIRHQ